MYYTLENSGVTTRAHYSRANVNEIFLPLLRRLTVLREQKGSRVLALLAAPPAAGKSTLAALLEALSRSEGGLCPLTAVAMDGFHRRQAWLLSHSFERDGRQVPMVKIKGAPQTFDVEKLLERARRVAAGEDCPWPKYDRKVHDPVEDGRTVTGEIVLLEGNYLLLDADGWRELRGIADYSISVSADPEMLRERLLRRHLAGGKSREDALAIVDGSDMANIRLCLARSARADLRLTLEGDGEYRVLE